MFQSHIEISALNYTNVHHSLRNFNNECLCMCVSIGFNESFDDGKDKSCVFSLRNFNTKIQNVRVCVSVLHLKRWNDMQL